MTDDDNNNRGPLLRAVAITLVILAFTSFCLRAYVRTQMVKAFGLDDWLMLLATITFILFVACVITGVHYGTGQLSKYLTDEAYSEAMKVSAPSLANAYSRTVLR